MIRQKHSGLSKENETKVKKNYNTKKWTNDFEQQAKHNRRTNKPS